MTDAEPNATRVDMDQWIAVLVHTLDCILAAMSNDEHLPRDVVEAARDARASMQYDLAHLPHRCLPWEERDV